jgi:hypothetical protein
MGMLKGVIRCYSTNLNGWTPHSMGIHYMAHKANFGIQILSYFSMINIIFIYFEAFYKKIPKALQGI